MTLLDYLLASPRLMGLIIGSLSVLWISILGYVLFKWYAEMERTTTDD